MRVAIIGAGVSGLQVCKHLTDAGIPCDVFEAARVVGGRVRAARFAGKQVDLGAKWFLVETGQGDMPHAVFLGAGGEELEWPFLLREDLASYLDESVLRTQRDLVSQRDLSAAQVLDSLVRRKNLSELEKTVFEAHRYLHVDFEFGAPADQVSVLHNYGKKLNQIVFARGKFTRVLKSFRLYMSRVRYVTKVLKITKQGTSYTLTTSTGELTGYSHVVSTVSVVVLQRNSIEFVPPLPLEKTRAWSKFQMSYDTSVYVQVEGTTWPYAYDVLVHATKRTHTFHVWFDLSRYFGCCVLLCSYAHAEARRVDQLTPDAFYSELLTSVRIVLKSPRVQVKNYLLTRWSDDELTYGAYSNWPAGFSSAEFEVMRLREGNILFAGEHTCDLYHGYYQGALRSGDRVGLELVREWARQGKTRRKRRTASSSTKKKSHYQVN